MARLIIERFFSRCSACGGNASMSETSHIHGGPKSGWSEGSRLSDTNGCGVVFDEEPENPYAWLDKLGEIDGKTQAS